MMCSKKKSEAPKDGGSIHLEQFLKMRGVVGTGGQAKILIQAGEIRVNGVTETRRKRQLQQGDKVEWDGEVWVVTKVARRS